MAVELGGLRPRPRPPRPPPRPRPRPRAGIDGRSSPSLPPRILSPGGTLKGRRCGLCFVCLSVGGTAKAKAVASWGEPFEASSDGGTAKSRAAVTADAKRRHATSRQAAAAMLTSTSIARVCCNRGLRERSKETACAMTSRRSLRSRVHVCTACARVQVLVRPPPGTRRKQKSATRRGDAGLGRRQRLHLRAARAANAAHANPGCATFAAEAYFTEFVEGPALACEVEGPALPASHRLCSFVVRLLIWGSRGRSYDWHAT